MRISTRAARTAAGILILAGISLATFGLADMAAGSTAPPAIEVEDVALYFSPLYALSDGRNDSCSFTLNVKDLSGEGGVARLLAFDDAELALVTVPADGQATLVRNHRGEGLYEATDSNTVPLRVEYRGTLTPVASLIDPAIERTESCLPDAGPGPDVDPERNPPMVAECPEGAISGVTFRGPEHAESALTGIVELDGREVAFSVAPDPDGLGWSLVPYFTAETSPRLVVLLEADHEVTSLEPICIVPVDEPPAETTTTTVAEPPAETPTTVPAIEQVSVESEVTAELLLSSTPPQTLPMTGKASTRTALVGVALVGLGFGAVLVARRLG